MCNINGTDCLYKTRDLPSSSGHDRRFSIQCVNFFVVLCSMSILCIMCSLVCLKYV